MSLTMTSGIGRASLSSVWAAEATATDLGFGLGKADVETPFAEPDAFQKELHRQRGLSSAWQTCDEIETTLGEAPATPLIE